MLEQVPRIMEGVVILSKDRDLKTYNESNSILHSICDFKFVYGLMVLKLILSNTDNLSRYLSTGRTGGCHHCQEDCWCCR